LRHRPGDIHQRVDPAEAAECVIHDFFSGCWFTKIERKHETFSSEGLRFLRCLLQVCRLARSKREMKNPATVGLQ
jgi:hypothetical protein